MLARSGAFRRALGRRAAPVAPRRPMSLLGAIFGIGEFEGARNQALGGATGKQHAFEIALLEVRGVFRLLCGVGRLTFPVYCAVCRYERAPQVHAAEGNEVRIDLDVPRFETDEFLEIGAG